MSLKPWLQILDYFTLAPLRETLLNVRTLTPEQRRMALGGYMVLALVGGSVIGWRILRDVLPGVLYPAPGGVTRELSVLTIFICSVGFALGWGYILVGAIRTRLSFFFMAFGLFIVNMLWMRVSLIPALMLVRLIGVIPLVLVVGGVLWWGKRHFAASPARFILSVAGLIWMGLAVFWFTGEAANRAFHLQNIFGLIYFAAVPLWVLAGAAVINFCASAARHVTLQLHEWLAPETLRRLTLAILCLHPLLTFLVGIPFFILFVTNDPTLQGIANWFGLDLLATLPLTFAALVSVARTRWSTRTAGLLLSIRLTLFLFIVVLQILVLGQLNMAELGLIAVEKLGIIPSEVFFIGTLLLTVLGFFIPLAREDSARFPQTLRVYWTFGAAILIVSMMFFFLSAREVETGKNLASGVLLPGLLTLGLYYGGFVYVIFLIWRRKPDFLGDLAAWEQETVPQPQTVLPRRGLAFLVLLLPFWAMMCSCCFIIATAPFRAP